MLVGGTGITPMLQALHAILGTKDDTTQVSMLVGNRTSVDILAKETLDAWTAAHKGQLDVTHVLSNETEQSDWPGERGFITAELIRAKFPAPRPDALVFVCGPSAMYDAVCGPRGEKEVTGIMKQLGYSSDMVVKF